MQRMPILSDSDMNLFELKTRYTRNYLTFAGKNNLSGKAERELLPVPKRERRGTAEVWSECNKAYRGEGADRGGGVRVAHPLCFQK